MGCILPKPSTTNIQETAFDSLRHCPDPVPCVPSHTCQSAAALVFSNAASHPTNIKLAPQSQEAGGEQDFLDASAKEDYMLLPSMAPQHKSQLAHAANSLQHLQHPRSSPNPSRNALQRRLQTERKMLTCAPDQLLADVSNMHFISAGAFGQVFAALWQASVPVAVKLILSGAPPSRPQAAPAVRTPTVAEEADEAPPRGAQDEEGVVSKVTWELLLSKSLAHPNIVQTYVARCAHLTEDFVRLVTGLAGPAGGVPTALACSWNIGGAPGGSAALYAAATAYVVGGQPAPAATNQQQPCCSSGPLLNNAATQRSDEGGSNRMDTLPTRDITFASRVPAGLPATPGFQKGVVQEAEADVFCAAATSPQDLAGQQAAAAGPQDLAGQHAATTAPGPGKMASRQAAIAAVMGASGLARPVSGPAWVNLDPTSRVHQPPPLTWRELALSARLQPGQYLSVCIMELCSFGTLSTAINSGLFQVAATGPDIDAKRRRQRYRALLRTAKEIAQGLDHLHKLGVVHGDLKPGNVLLKGSRSDARGFEAQLSDFGLSSMLGSDATSSSGAATMGAAKGTVPYMAPETFDGCCNKSADVYALGIMLWEMVTGQQPYKDISPGRIYISVKLHGLRPSWPSLQLFEYPELMSLYVRCVDGDPKARPKAKEVARELLGIEARVRSSLQARSEGGSDSVPVQV